MKHITRIEQDLYPENPREWDEPRTTMACKHSHYNLGDKDGFDKLREAIQLKYNRMTKEEKDYMDYDADDIAFDIELFEKYNCGIILPLYLYDHSGITMRTSAFSCPWDSGQVGVIFITYEQLRKELNVKSIHTQHKDYALTVLNSEVELYSAYLEGDVYYVTVYSITEDKELELYVEHELEIDDVESWSERDWQDALDYLTEEDSCGGIYGYSEAVEYVKDMKENMQ